MKVEIYIIDLIPLKYQQNSAKLSDFSFVTY